MATLGSKAAAKRNDSMREDFSDSCANFYLQYFFPPSSVGETGRTGGPGAGAVGLWRCCAHNGVVVVHGGVVQGRAGRRWT